MIKTLVYNIEGIHDMQKILKIQKSGSLLAEPTKSAHQSPEIHGKRSLVDDITRKYSNIKLQKVSMSSPSDPKTVSIPETLKVVPDIVEITHDKQAMPDDSLTRSDRPDVHRCFMCISCSEKFQKFALLEDHLKTCKASTTKQFKCFCGKILCSRKELSSHVSLSHRNNKQKHICSVCKKVLSSLFNLQNHMKMHKKSSHETLKGFSCQTCKMKHPDLDELKKHRIICKQKRSET